MARFLPTGQLDESFGINGVTLTEEIWGLLDITNTITDQFGNIYLAFNTSADILEVMQFVYQNYGEYSYGYSEPQTLPNVPTVSSIGFDSNGNIVVSGTTFEKQVFVAQWTGNGLINEQFGANGIAQSPIISDLSQEIKMVIDGLDRIKVIAVVKDHQGTQNFVRVKYDAFGYVDTIYHKQVEFTEDLVARQSSQGIASVALVSNGQIVASLFNPILHSSVSSIQKLPSDDEIYGLDTKKLSPVGWSIYRYGNNPNRFRKMILFDYLLNKFITQADIRESVQDALDETLTKYVKSYDAQEFNLVWDAYTLELKLNQVCQQLQANYSECSDGIDSFFASLWIRIEQLGRAKN